MRAAFYRRTGSAAEVLELAELPDPEPGAGEVRVRLRASGINPTDVKSRAGHRGRAPVFDCQIPGHDGAGEIDAIGDGVHPERIGERVWVFHAALGRPAGTSASYVVVPAWQAVPLHSAGFDFGASLGIPFITAHVCLFRDGALHGRTVLVSGGAGAVGNAAVQLAKRGGATVVTTVSTDEKAELARRAGADHVVVGYERPDAVKEIQAAAPDGVDRIVEVALPTNLALDLSVLATRGAIVTYATGPGDVEIPISRLIQANARLDFMLVYRTPREELEAAARAIATALREEDALLPLPAISFPLERIAEAHALVESAPVGRVLLDIA